MNKQPSRIGLYLVLIIALVAGYFYLNNQVVSQSNYTHSGKPPGYSDKNNRLPVQ